MESSLNRINIILQHIFISVSCVQAATLFLHCICAIGIIRKDKVSEALLVASHKKKVSRFSVVSQC